MAASGVEEGVQGEDVSGVEEFTSSFPLIS